MALQIELLNSSKHNRPDFCCGKESLDNYICKQAAQDLKKLAATVFVLINEPDDHILAYYTLSAYTIDITDLDVVTAKRLPRYPLLPATLLGRLAVDRRQTGNRFGELMLIDALKKALGATAMVASLAIIAEALDENAVNFYLKYGFQPFNQNPLKLYLPMQAIEKL